MNFMYIIAGSIILILAWHLGAADSITTTISCAGATFLTTAVIGPDQTYSNSLFTDDRVNLSRNLDTGKGVDSTVQITGSGTVGVDEYQAQTRENPKRVMQCNLLPVAAGAGQHDEITASGLFQSGQYLSHREITNESTRSQTSINGTGQVLMKAASTDGNTSTRGTTYAGGPMQIQEQVLFNGGDDE